MVAVVVVVVVVVVDRLSHINTIRHICISICNSYNQPPRSVQYDTPCSPPGSLALAKSEQIALTGLVGRTPSEHSCRSGQGSGA